LINDVAQGVVLVAGECFTVETTEAHDYNFVGRLVG